MWLWDHFYLVCVCDWVRAHNILIVRRLRYRQLRSEHRKYNCNLIIFSFSLYLLYITRLYCPRFKLNLNEFGMQMIIRRWSLFNSEVIFVTMLQFHQICSEQLKNQICWQLILFWQRRNNESVFHPTHPPTPDTKKCHREHFYHTFSECRHTFLTLLYFTLSIFITYFLFKKHFLKKPIF